MADILDAAKTNNDTNTAISSDTSTPAPVVPYPQGASPTTPTESPVEPSPEPMMAAPLPTSTSTDDIAPTPSPVIPAHEPESSISGADTMTPISEDSLIVPPPEEVSSINEPTRDTATLPEPSAPPPPKPQPLASVEEPPKDNDDQKHDVIGKKKSHLKILLAGLVVLLVSLPLIGLAIKSGTEIRSKAGSNTVCLDNCNKIPIGPGRDLCIKSCNSITPTKTPTPTTGCTPNTTDCRGGREYFCNASRVWIATGDTCGPTPKPTPILSTCDNCTLGIKRACTTGSQAGQQTCVTNENCIGRVNVGSWGGCVATTTPAPTTATCGQAGQPPTSASCCLGLTPVSGICTNVIANISCEEKGGQCYTGTTCISPHTSVNAGAGCANSGSICCTPLNAVTATPTGGSSSSFCTTLTQKVAAGGLIPDNPKCGSCTGGNWCGTWVAENGIPIAGSGYNKGDGKSCGLWEGPDHFLIPSTGKTIEGCFPEPSCPTKAAISCSTSGGGGGNTPTPIQCTNIKIYKDNAIINPATLQPGDAVSIAYAPGTGTTKIRFRINSTNDTDWLETTTKSGEEFRLDWTVPTGITSFSIEAQYFDGVTWH